MLIINVQQNGEDEQYLCENQLLFNPESNICDYPINVVCGGKKKERNKGVDYIITSTDIYID